MENANEGGKVGTESCVISCRRSAERETEAPEVLSLPLLELPAGGLGRPRPRPSFIPAAGRGRERRNKSFRRDIDRYRRRDGEGAEAAEQASFFRCVR